jgi:2-polyprenyl-3-methyl-5-hydroxy-6-metoxy-1,4-benzoquinol methylase
VFLLANKENPMCTACSTLDPQRTEAFAGRMVEIANHGALSLMISVGHRTGLFDALAQSEEATAASLAETARLHPRYVREWLGAMVTGGLVELDPETETYRLPAEHARWLTRDSSPDNLAVTAQFIALLGGVEDEIVECFRRGGGVPYSRYRRFHEVMAEESAQSVVSGLEDHVLPLIDGLVDRLESGIDVLDVGCGSGRAMNWLARRFPNSRFVGYDFSEEAIANARREARLHDTRNVTFAVRDVASVEERDQYDLVTAFDAIHDQARPAAVLEVIRHALRPDGVFLMQDIRAATAHQDNIDNPLAPLLYTISCMHCMTVSLAAGGAGLGAMWGREQAEAMLAGAGFRDVDVREIEHDIMNYWYVARSA